MKYPRKSESEHTMRRKLTDLTLKRAKITDRPLCGVRCCLQALRVRAANKPTAVIINKFRDQKKFAQARQHLIDSLGHIPIFAIRATILFERVSRDGL